MRSLCACAHSDKYKRDPGADVQTKGQLPARASEAGDATKPPPSPQHYGKIKGGKLERTAGVLRVRAGLCVP